MTRRKISAAALTLLAALLPAAAHAATYDAGADDHEIRLGQTVPYSGPLSAYGTVGRAMAAYFAKVDWEAPAALELRAAHLLPWLFLARVDGKSPVEYITGEADKNRVRRVARSLLADPPARLQAIRQAWAQELAK